MNLWKTRWFSLVSLIESTRLRSKLATQNLKLKAGNQNICLVGGRSTGQALIWARWKIGAPTNSVDWCFLFLAQERTSHPNFKLDGTPRVTLEMEPSERSQLECPILKTDSRGFTKRGSNCFDQIADQGKPYWGSSPG